MKIESMPWLPTFWLCNHCENHFITEDLTSKEWNTEEVGRLAKKNDFDAYVKNNLFTNSKIVFVARAKKACKGCDEEVEFDAVFHFVYVNHETGIFKLEDCTICSSYDLTLIQNGFVFRGIDIYANLSEILIRWWATGARLFIVNPYITPEGWKLLAQVNHIILNCDRSLGTINPSNDPFEMIIMQRSQNWNKDTPKTLLRQAQDEVLKKTPNYILQQSGFEHLEKKLFLTVPDNDKLISNDVVGKNSGKFHAKFYAGLYENYAEIVLTSFNLIESEFLQMETFQFVQEVDAIHFKSEIKKITEDRFMQVKND